MLRAAADGSASAMNSSYISFAFSSERERELFATTSPTISYPGSAPPLSREPTVIFIASKAGTVCSAAREAMTVASFAAILSASATSCE